VNFLIFSPFIVALLVYPLHVKLRNLAVIVYLGMLSMISVDLYFSNEIISFEFTHFWHDVFVIFDLSLLAYFLQQGMKHKSVHVWFLALIQLLLYIFVLNIDSSKNSADIISDELSKMMYLIINIVGSIIIIYALEYIQSEDTTQQRKNFFISMLIFFLGVMNFIVSVNNIEIFFLLFELTTLCSYILISFRKDDISIDNSIRALWMNQIGGVAILLGVIFAVFNHDTIYFDILIKDTHGGFLLAIFFLTLAAVVKGASFPFQNWLLGAMVAPTPVSAILHSATMVKIAPFLILKLSPAFSTFFSTTLAVFGAFVFFAASLMALSKDFFKEILGLSTIALLALMISLAAINTPESIEAAKLLLIFHAISKALLFLNAGILEKKFHLKYISQIDSLPPKMLFFIIFGFASLTLPPFGAFFGKFLAYEAIVKSLHAEPLHVVVLILLSIGSVLLSILYFKSLSSLFARKAFEKEKVKLEPFYDLTLKALFVLMAFGIFYMFDFAKNYEIFIAFFLIFSTPLLLSTLLIKNATRINEYNCGEKDEFRSNSFEFILDEKYTKIITVISVLLLVLLFMGAL
jgi:ech hydrogenase subunit A